mmetsp:Transcript_20080/g.27899  ORF Transcript_20080/g.27899 Transcript_20080/m.27899 type:complete len:341 (+) Transcript_20080:87-1109(+)
MGSDCSLSRGYGGTPKKILVTGASGYLGQFIVDALLARKAKENLTISGATHSISPKEAVPFGVKGVKMDGSDLKSVKSVLKSVKPDIIINTMALSSPAVCEKKKELAENLNSAKALVDAVKSIVPQALVIHISTDQVYSGVSPDGPYTNKSSTIPINAYGKTKLMAEENLRQLEDYLILRSSGIYGPPPPRQCSKKGTFLQMTEGLLKKPEKSPFFSEEKRSHIYVRDVVKAVLYFVFNYDASLYAEQASFERIYCMGGNGTWSRDKYAEVVAEKLNLKKDSILPMTRAECKQKWAHTFKSPADITMESSRLYTILGKPCVPLSEGIEDMIKRQEILKVP